MSDALERVTLITPDPLPPEGHDQKMIDLVDSKSAAAVSSERPAWLPEKFKTVEDMAASYSALEAKLGSAAPVAEPAVPPAAVAPAAEAEAVVAKAGLDMSALNTEFQTAGALSADSYAKLAAAGVEKPMVDAYIAGQQALATQFQSEVMAATPGGADKYGEMMEWAKVNLTPVQIEAYNTAVSSGNKDQAKLAVAGLGVSFKAAVGIEPKLSGGSTGASAADVFESIAQMKVAMASKEYKTDPAYRAKVQAKLGRSNIM